MNTQNAIRRVTFALAVTLAFIAANLAARVILDGAPWWHLVMAVSTPLAWAAVAGFLYATRPVRDDA